MGVVALGLEGAAEREGQLHAVFFGGCGVRLQRRHLLHFLGGKDVGLGVGQAPVGVAVVALDAVCLLVEVDGAFDVAVGLVHVSQRDGIEVVVRIRFLQLPIAGDGAVAVANAAARRGMKGTNALVLGRFGQQLRGVFVRRGELLHAQQDVDVLDVRFGVRGLELQAALQQELRFVEDLVACAYLGQQPHAFHMGLVASQEVLAEPFRIRQPVFG